MKIKLISSLVLLITLLSSCENTPGIANPGELEVLPYYDLKGFIEAEIPKIDGKNVTKSIRINGIEEQVDRIFSQEEWKEEFDAFIEADINKPSLIESFTTELEKDVLVHRAKPEAKTLIKEIKVRIVDDKPVWITFKGSKESIFYTTYIHGGIYMNNREMRIDHYDLETTQKIWFLKPNNIKIQAVIQ